MRFDTDEAEAVVRICFILAHFGTLSFPLSSVEVGVACSSVSLLYGILNLRHLFVFMFLTAHVYVCPTLIDVIVPAVSHCKKQSAAD